MKFIESKNLLAKSKKVIPAQAQTFSKNWTQYPLGNAPIFADKADAGYIWDVDGNKFIDWPMALGPLLLGHNNTEINILLSEQLKKGIAFSLPHHLEVSLAEKLIDYIPYAEAVRFGKNGSDATSAAVRAARAYTNRDHILCCGYHGWQDWYIGTTLRSKGVPRNVANLTHPFTYNNIDSLKDLLSKYEGKVAAIIMEPIGIEHPKKDFLKEVRQLASHHRCVLIFDECWTGFRLHKQGSYGKYNIKPDLACFGKALGNGIPISVVLGDRDIMKVFEDIFFSFTFAGDVLGMVAANAVLNIIESKPVIERINETGKKLFNGVDKIIKEHNLENYLSISGYSARNAISFFNDKHDGLLLKSIFQQESIKRGILAAGWHAPSYAHTDEDVERTLDSYNKVCKLLAQSIAKNNLKTLLKSEMVKPVFRKL